MLAKGATIVFAAAPAAARSLIWRLTRKPVNSEVRAEQANLSSIMATLAKLHLFVEQVSHGFAHCPARIERRGQGAAVDGLLVGQDGFTERFLYGP